MDSLLHQICFPISVLQSTVSCCNGQAWVKTNIISTSIKLRFDYTVLFCYTRSIKTFQHRDSCISTKLRFDYTTLFCYIQYIKTSQHRESYSPSPKSSWAKKTLAALMSCLLTLWGWPAPHAILILYCCKSSLCTEDSLPRNLFVGCLTSQQHASVSLGRICSDNFMCCHTEIEVAD